MTDALAPPCSPALEAAARHPALQAVAARAERLHTGVDLVRVADVTAAIAAHGERYLSRVFTAAERADAAAAPALAAQRLAARYAAKEAALKALGLAQQPTRLRELEVVRADDGSVRLALHGAAADHVRRQGMHSIALSLSHEGDHAVAFVVALRDPL